MMPIDYDSSPYPGPCQVSWHPNIFQPVVWGTEYIYKGKNGAPTNMMVIYPSMQISTPLNPPPPLAGCGKYPVIYFFHGYSKAADPYPGAHYMVWEQTLRPLARAGYVVVVPDLATYPGQPDYGDAGIADAGMALYWLGNNWKWRAIMAQNRVGLVGHSFGGALALHYWYKLKYPKAVALLSSALVDVISSSWGVSAITSLSIPSVHMFGSGHDLTFHAEQQPDMSNRVSYWKYFPPAAHSVEFVGTGHYDYLATQFKCGYPSGPQICPFQWSLTADVLTTFFSKFLPTIDLGPNAALLSDSLVPPASFPKVGNDPEQAKFFAAYMKGGEDFVKSGCKAVFRWKAPSEGVAFVGP
jgi:acetyl esterase/lipase